MGNQYSSNTNRPKSRCLLIVTIHYSKLQGKHPLMVVLMVNIWLKLHLVRINLRISRLPQFLKASNTIAVILLRRA